MIKEDYFWYSVTKEGIGNFSREKPIRREDGGFWMLEDWQTNDFVPPYYLYIGKKDLPQITWDNEPIRLKITIKMEEV